MNDNKETISVFFDTLNPLRLRQLPAKLKKQRMVVEVISNTFEKGEVYTEQEVNRHLANIYQDYATIRRLLIDMHFMERLKDGSAYRLCQESATM